VASVADREGERLDPETTRLLITAIATLGGAAIGFFSAQNATSRTLQGQRQLARDKDVRDARRETTGSILRVADQQVFLFNSAQRALLDRDFAHVFRLLTDIEAVHPDSYAYLAIDDAGFISSLRSYADEFERTLKAFVDEGKEQEATKNSKQLADHREALKQVSEAFRKTVINLHLAAEAYWSRLT
jgi:hypothetical protein